MADPRDVDQPTEVTFALRSSWLVSATYDSESLELTLSTTDGNEYTLSGVPPQIAYGLRDAPSAGKYWNQVLKGRF